MRDCWWSFGIIKDMRNTPKVARHGQFYELEEAKVKTDHDIRTNLKGWLLPISFARNMVGRTTHLLWVHLLQVVVPLPGPHPLGIIPVVLLEKRLTPILHRWATSPALREKKANLSASIILDELSKE